jgi:PKD repeat protein
MVNAAQKRTMTFVCLLLISGSLFMSHVPTARAFGADIDLTYHNLQNISQKDPRWSLLPLGPNQAPTPDSAVYHARCGCYLAALSTMVSFYFGYFADRYSSQPHHPVPLRHGVTETSFNPVYLDQHIFLGKGYEPSDRGKCGVNVLPHALEDVAIPYQYPAEGEPLIRTPSGVSILAKPWYDKELIDRNLLNLRPTLVSYRRPDSGTAHVYIIAGWDEDEQKYRVLDPAEPTGSPSFIPASYDKWEARIDETIDIIPVNEQGSWLQLRDDPAPVEFFAIDPLGRRTGYDPERQQFAMEDPNASYIRAGAWTDLLGVLPAAVDPRILGLRSPVDGIYRFEIIGTATASLKFTFVRVDGSEETLLSTYDGTIAVGQRLKYVVRYQSDGPSTVTQVATFTPQAEAGSERVGLVDTPITFDAHRSVAFDGNLVDYAWSFGDGSIGSGPTVSHTYSAPGEYEATLTVTDDRGQTGSDTVTITVAHPESAGASGRIELASVSSSGVVQDGNSGTWSYPAISANGRFVAFASYGTNLVPNDTNQNSDVFVHDRQTGATERVSVTSSGAALATPFEWANSHPAISADGRYVAFTSLAGLDPGDTDSEADIYVHDGQTGVTELISLLPDGTSSASANWSAVNADGQFVAFHAGSAIYLRDRQLGTTTLVGSARRSSLTRPTISADGRFVAYDRVPTSGYDEVVLWDRETKTTELVSVSSAGVRANQHSRKPSMSANGRYIAFESLASNLVTNDTNSTTDIYVHDRVAGTTRRVSLSSGGLQGDLPSERPAISADGSAVAFDSAARTLVPEPASPLSSDVFFHDLATGTTRRLSTAASGIAPNGNSESSAISADGRAVAFLSSARNLIDGVNVGSANNAYVWSALEAQPLADPAGPYIGWAHTDARPASIAFDATGSIDPSGAALSAAWDFGDGSPLVTTNDLSTPTLHRYVEPGQYTITLTVRNGQRDSLPVQTTVTILPAPQSDRVDFTPSCGPSGTVVDVAGTTVQGNSDLLESGWNERNGPLTLEPINLTIDGTPHQVHPSLPSFGIRTSFTANGSGTHVLVLGGASTTFTGVCPLPLNWPPEADAGGPFYSGVAGVPVVFDGSGSADVEGSPLSYVWDLDDGATAEGMRPQHVYAEPGVYFVTLVVHDGVNVSQATAGTRSFAQVTITEASEPSDVSAPTTAISLMPAANSYGWNNTPVVVQLDAFDAPNGSGVKEIAYDTSGAQPRERVTIAGASTSFVVDAEGVTTVAGFARDNAGNTEAPVQSTTVRVDRSAPIISITAPAPYAVLSAGVVVGFNATDGTSGVAGVTATVSNGVTERAVSSGDKVDQPGVYTLTVAATDRAGNTANTAQQFVVYDSSGGFVTGGGWIASPAGAATADPSLAGPATFGFVSKYQKGATTPSGVTQFQFQLADLNFHAERYEWLVVSGTRAQFKGTGTINRQGDYGFLLTAVDGQLTGGSGIDLFRIKIWDRATGQVVYDTQAGADESALPSTQLQAGSIVIHTRKS